MCALKFSQHSPVYAMVLIAVLNTIFVGRAYANTPAEGSEPLIHALTELEKADWDNRWLGYGIALFGAATGLGLGAWALYGQPLAQGEHPDPAVTASSLLIVGSAMTQIVHGGMRYDERVRGALQARELLEDSSARELHTMYFLRQRAKAARSTRFWGGVMTTAQGLGSTMLGLRLWLGGENSTRTTGIVLSGLGLLNMAIGAVHFPGKPRSERILLRTEEEQAEALRLRLEPITREHGLNPRLGGARLTLSGRF